MGLHLTSNGRNLTFEILVSCRPVLFPASTLYYKTDHAARQTFLQGRPSVGEAEVRSVKNKNQTILDSGKYLGLKGISDWTSSLTKQRLGERT